MLASAPKGTRITASAAQLIANRDNATHSTGPRTPEGKARCSRNALRHGLSAAHLVIRQDERDDFEALENPGTAAFLDRLGRYLSRAQRAYYRALNELRRLQTNRGLRAIKLTEEEEAQVPAIADIDELTKQTQSEVTHKAMNMALDMIEYETGIRLANARELHGRKVDGAAPQR